jgi:hypothetical protein
MATNDKTKNELLKWLEANLAPKRFKTGSRGYGAYGKAEDIDGKRFQVTVNIVEIGSGK